MGTGAGTTGQFTRLAALLGLLLSIPASAAEPPSHLVVLQYHHVSAATPAATSISPADFATHLNWLEDNDFRIVPLEQAVEALRAGEPLPDRTAAITFDDGYQDIYTDAFPLLRQRNWPFTVFVNPEPHDENLSGWASWDELREMAANGATIANHTMSHLFMLRQQDGEDESAWLERLKLEILQAENRILDETGQTHRLLAYPYGETDETIESLVAELGYTAFGQQSGAVGSDSNFTDLPRFPLSGTYSELDTFITKMMSLPMGVFSAEPDSVSGDGTLLHRENHPTLTLQLHDADVKVLNCFASGQGAIPVVDEGNGRYVVRAPEPLPVGRSRYNCTYASEWPGRFYWYSYAWVRRDKNGEWTHQ